MTKKTKKKSTPAKAAPGRYRPVLICTEDLTKKSFAEECDINNIVAKFTRGIPVNHLSRREPQYGESPELDFFTAASIQAEIRSRIEEEDMYPETDTNDPEPASEAAQETQAEDRTSDQETAEKPLQRNQATPVEQGA